MSVAKGAPAQPPKVLGATRRNHDVAERLHNSHQSRVTADRQARQKRLKPWWGKVNGVVVRSEAELLDVFKARDLDHLMKKWSAMFAPWTATYEYGDGEEGPAVIVGVGGWGHPLEYPEDLGNLLASLDTWANAADFTEATDRLEAQISDVEGFTVIVREFRKDTDEDDPRIAYYPYMRKAPDDWTVRQWEQQRFARHYADLYVGVETPKPQPPYGTTLIAPSPNMKLKTLRKMWASK